MNMCIEIYRYIYIYIYTHMWIYTTLVRVSRIYTRSFLVEQTTPGFFALSDTHSIASDIVPWKWRWQLPQFSQPKMMSFTWYTWLYHDIFCHTHDAKPLLNHGVIGIISLLMIPFHGHYLQLLAQYFNF